MLPSGEIRPYFKHSAFGKWKADHTVVMSPGRIDKAMDALDHVQIPGWMIPCLMPVVFGGSAFLIVWIKSGLVNPVDFIFVAMVAILGFVIGCFVWWLGPRKT